jgi:hypothetical protein
MLMVNGRLETVTLSAYEPVEGQPEGRVRLQYGALGVKCRLDTTVMIYVPNARFWVWWNGDWVKLTLEPGGVCEFGMSHATDEGWAAEYQKYEYDDEAMVVRSTMVDDGVDCDGRLTREAEYTCSLHLLLSMSSDMDEYGWRPDRPEWQKGHACQRDYEAEKAGY